MPLTRAASRGHTEVVTLLLARGADANAGSLNGLTALHWAATGGYANSVRALIAKGADPNARDDESRTALIVAATNGYLDTVKELAAAVQTQTRTVVPERPH